MTVRRLDPNQIEQVEAAMRAAAIGIAAEKWPAILNPHCKNCRVRLVCPEWPEGREAFSA